MRIECILHRSLIFAGVACGSPLPSPPPAAGLQVDAPWPMYRHGPDHGGRSSSRGPSSPHLRWTWNPGDTISSGLSSYCPPVIATDGTLYIATRRRSVVALSSDGTVKWQVPTGGGCDGSPAIAHNGTVLAVMNALHAIGPNGVEIWTYPPPADGLGGSPAIATDGTIYVSGEDSGLYAVNPDGSPKWHFAASSGGKSSPAVANDGSIYVGADTKIVALTPAGEKKWDAAVEVSEHLAPMIDDKGNVAAILHDMLIFSPDGAPIATIPADARWSQFPAALAPDGQWVLGSSSGLTKFDSAGTASWKVGPGATSVPVIDLDGNVYVSDSFCTARSYDAAGQQRWSLDLPAGSCGGPVLGADGTLYLTSESAGILALSD